MRWTIVARPIQPLMHPREAGFSLVEMLVALSLVTVALGPVFQLVMAAHVAVRTARDTAMSAWLAAQKMEQLLGAAWTVDRWGLPLNDTTTSFSSRDAADGSGPGLALSTGAALRYDTPGFVDYLDAHGEWLGDGVSLPPGAVYIRRWAVTPLPSDPSHTLVLQVLVAPRVRVATSPPAGASGQPGAVYVVTIRTRTSP